MLYALPISPFLNWWWVQNYRAPYYAMFSSPIHPYSISLRSKTFLQHPALKHRSLVFPSIWGPRLHTHTKLQSKLYVVSVDVTPSLRNTSVIFLYLSCNSGPFVSGVCSHWLSDLSKWTEHVAALTKPTLCVRNGFMHVCAFPRQWRGLPLHMQAAIYFPFFTLCSVSQIATHSALFWSMFFINSGSYGFRDSARHLFILMMSVYWSENINTSIV